MAANYLQKKAADGGFLKNEDAKVGLLVSFSRFFLVSPSSRLVSRVKPESVLVSGYLA